MSNFGHLGRTSSESSKSQCNVTVAVRVRPLSNAEKAGGATVSTETLQGKYVVISKECQCRFLRSQQASVNEYEYDCSFGPESTQREVYEKTTKPYISSIIAGKNVTAFAYGSTGSGKTHTMMGNSDSDSINAAPTDRLRDGIIPCSLRDLFSQVQEAREMANEFKGEEWKVHVSYLEVYNEQVLDLLNPDGTNLPVREDSAKGIVIVSGLTWLEAMDAESVLLLLQEGNKHRKTEPTAANKVSSRSHAVLQVVVSYYAFDEELTAQPASSRRKSCISSSSSTLNRKKESSKQRESRLCLIDLAGSERASATLNRGIRLVEGANINKSLLALANCINALAESHSSSILSTHRNVKFRDSKLTHLLKSSLEGSCNRLVMIANINPNHTCYEDSHNTLKYADRAKNMKISVSVSSSSSFGVNSAASSNNSSKQRSHASYTEDGENLPSLTNSTAARGKKDYVDYKSSSTSNSNVIKRKQSDVDKEEEGLTGSAKKRGRRSENEDVDRKSSTSSATSHVSKQGQFSLSRFNPSSINSSTTTAINGTKPAWSDSLSSSISARNTRKRRMTMAELEDEVVRISSENNQLHSEISNLKQKLTAKVVVDEKKMMVDDTVDVVIANKRKNDDDDEEDDEEESIPSPPVAPPRQLVVARLEDASVRVVKRSARNSLMLPSTKIPLLDMEKVVVNSRVSPEEENRGNLSSRSARTQPSKNLGGLESVPEVSIAQRVKRNRRNSIFETLG